MPHASLQTDRVPRHPSGGRGASPEHECRLPSVGACGYTDGSPGADISAEGPGSSLPSLLGLASHLNYAVRQAYTSRRSSENAGIGPPLRLALADSCARRPGRVTRWLQTLSTSGVRNSLDAALERGAHEVHERPGHGVAICRLFSERDAITVSSTQSHGPHGWSSPGRSLHRRGALSKCAYAQRVPPGVRRASSASESKAAALKEERCETSDLPTSVSNAGRLLREAPPPGRREIELVASADHNEATGPVRRTPLRSASTSAAALLTSRYHAGASEL